jgi:hypothetical protein
VHVASDRSCIISASDSATDSAGARCGISVTSSNSEDRNRDWDRNAVVRAQCVYLILIAVMTATYSYLTVRTAD